MTTKPLGRIANLWLSTKRHRCHRRALKDALAAFGSAHPTWTNTRFDLPFLSGRGAAALEAGEPQALARAWTQQFHYRDEVRRADDVRRLTPAVETFIKLFGRAKGACEEGLQHQESSDGQPSRRLHSVKQK